MVETIQCFADKLDMETYQKCIAATKDYINSRDFIVEGRYETTSYLLGALQYKSEAFALKELNQQLDLLMQNMPKKETDWATSLKNLCLKTASTLLSTFDYAKSHPLSTMVSLLYGQAVLAATFPEDLPGEFSKQNTVDNNLPLAPFKSLSMSNIISNPKDYKWTLAGDIYGTPAGETLTGTSGDDNLYGNGGDDTLRGGLGDDKYYPILGKVIINDYDSSGSGSPYGGGTDTIYLGQGLTSANVTMLSRVDDNLVFYFDDVTKLLTINNHFSDERYTIESIVFADDSILPLTGEDIGFTLTVTTDHDIAGTYWDDVLIGSSITDILRAGAGNDKLYGNGGDDTLIGGVGNDEYYPILGQVTIQEYSSNGQYDQSPYGGGTDTIYLGQGLTSANVTMLSRVDDNLVFYFDDVTKLLTINEQFDSLGDQIENIIFEADLTTWNLASNTIILGQNHFSIYEAQRLSITTNNLRGLAVDSNDLLLSFTVSNVEYGQFESTDNPDVTITTMTQQQIVDGKILFIHDGGEDPPSFDIRLTDGSTTIGPFTANIIFTPVNEPPVLLKNELIVSQGQSVIITESNLNVYDIDTLPDGLTYLITSLINGQFELLTNVSYPVTAFTHQQVSINNVRFVHDGTINTPSYYVSVTDGEFPTVPQQATVYFNPPKIKVNNLHIEEKETVILSRDNIVAEDLDTPDNQITLYASNIAYGQFAFTYATSSAITQFSQNDINIYTVQFTHDGSELAPSYSLLANDGIFGSSASLANVTFVKINDVPVLVNNQLTLNEGETVEITTSHLLATDDDNTANELTFTISHSEHYGYFALVGNPTSEITTFTQYQVNIDQIIFKHDGSENEPAYWVTVSDGTAASEAALASITFTPINDPPVLVNNQLTITEGESKIITDDDLSASDPDTGDNELVFSFPQIEHGQFELLTNPQVAIYTFTQQQIKALQIRFVHDGDEQAPSYSVIVSDGVNSTPPDLVDIIYTPVNEPPYVNRPFQDQQVEEEQSFSIEIPQDTFIDPEGDVFVLTLKLADGRDAPSWIQLDTSGNTAVLKGESSDIGTTQFSLFATDPGERSAKTDFSIEVQENLSNVLRNQIIQYASGGGSIAVALYLLKRIYQSRANNKKRNDIDPFANRVQKRLRLAEVADFNETAIGSDFVKFIKKLKTELKTSDIDVKALNGANLEKLSKIVAAVVRTECERANTFYVPFLFFRIDACCTPESCDCCGLVRSKFVTSDIELLEEKLNSIASQVSQQYHGEHQTATDQLETIKIEMQPMS